MRVIGLIPSRYASTRFPGKGIADICGKPMLWWVYQHFVVANGIEKVFVATDDKRIVEVMDDYDIPCIMTSSECKTHLDRLYEASKMIEADYYINVNGDEPLITSECVEDLIPESISSESYAANGMMTLTNPVEAYDTSKIKIATDMQGYGLYMSRMPIPFPKGRGDYELKKFVGVQCFNKKALEFAHNTPRGNLESIEDIDEYRFIENGHKLKFINTNANTISVDTRKDLEAVRTTISKICSGGGQNLNCKVAVTVFGKGHMIQMGCCA